MKNKKITFSLIINFIIIISSTYGVYLQALRDGISVLKWYTDLSNIFAILTALISVIFTIRLLTSQKQIPDFVKFLYYCSTNCLTLTFLIVLFVLAPSKNPGGHKLMMFSSFGLFLHTISPVLAIINFIFIDTDKKLEFKSTYKAIIPTITYAVVVIILNILQKLDGPYFFLRVRAQPVYMSIIWVIALAILTYLINLGVWWSNKKIR